MFFFNPSFIIFPQESVSVSWIILGRKVLPIGPDDTLCYLCPRLPPYPLPDAHIFPLVCYVSFWFVTMRLTGLVYIFSYLLGLLLLPSEVIYY